MSRPFLPVSIVELEKIAAHARASNDKQTLQLVVHELGFRATSKAASLKQELIEGVGSVASSDVRSPSQGAGRAGLSVSRQVQTATAAAAKNTKAKGHRPTREQDEAIQFFRTGRSLKINAYAGTGKTSTLEMLSHSTKRRGQYLAFNRDIVADARKRFPSTVNCATTHSLAFRSVASRYGGSTAKLTEKISANQVAELFQLKGMRLGSTHMLKPRSQGFLILDTVRRFAISGSVEPLPSHVPLHGSLVSASEAVQDEARNFAVHGAKMLWKRMCDPRDAIPLGHDGYLKLWTLSEPTIAADFILLDEAQDTNPAVLSLLKKQECQLVYVGDKYQQIYEWRGAVNAMDEVQTDASTYLTTSFRFGTAIAEAATKLLQRMGETRPLTGNPALSSKIGPTPQARTILSRTNASTMTTVISALDAGRRPHLVGGKDELMRMLEGVADLKRGEPSAVPDFFGFSRWEEVVEFASSGDGEHLTTFVNLVKATGERQLMSALRRTADADACDLVVSTAHRAKGREWPTVSLTDDFLKSSNKPRTKQHEGEGDEHGETRLLYVAITRARESIEIPEPILRQIGLAVGRTPNSTMPPDAAPQSAPSGNVLSVQRHPPNITQPESSQGYPSHPPAQQPRTNWPAATHPAASPFTNVNRATPAPGTLPVVPPAAPVAQPKQKGFFRRLLGF